MSLLLVDLGNSRVKWMWSADGGATTARAASRRDHPLSELWERCWEGLPTPRGVVVASVAGEAIDASLSRWCMARWGLAPRFLSSTVAAHGVSNAYRDPAKLGVDRWAALVAAHTAWPGTTLCIADCGTAVTFDALEGNGQHLGGLILPGLTLMQRALSSATAGIESEGSSSPERGWLGRDTESGIGLGAIRAITAALEQSATELGNETQTEVTCLLTGGDAPRLLPHLGDRWQHHPTLVLEGARILAEEETKPAAFERS